MEIENNANERLDKAYLEELISLVLEQHEIALEVEVNQTSSCVLPLVTKFLECVNEPSIEEPTIEEIAHAIVEPSLEESTVDVKEEELNVFVFEPTEVFDPKELLEPREEETIQKDELIKEEAEEVKDIEIQVEQKPFRFTTWLQEMWDKVKK